MSKRIKDPVHGYISIPQAFVGNIIDTKWFQRLRNLGQTDTTRLVYPSATHSRFEHTLGVFHLGTSAFENIRPELSDGLDEEELEKIGLTLKCAALFHDIGHLPFSHLCEPFADEAEIDNELSNYGLLDVLDAIDRSGKLLEADPHEKLSCLIVLSKYADTIDAMGCDPNDVCAFLLGTSTKSENEWQWQVAAELLNSHIDVDRLDYMLRDDFMSGASLVSVDSSRMLNAYTTVDKRLALSEKAHSTIGNYLDGRNAVYLWVTQHHKVICSHAMIEDMVDELVNEVLDIGAFSVDHVIETGIDDSYLMEKIREAAQEGTSDYLTRLYTDFRERNFLSSCWKHVIDYNRRISSDPTHSWLLHNARTNRAAIEEPLMEQFDFERHEVFASASHVPGYDVQDLQEIYLDYGGSGRAIDKFDIYQSRKNLFRSLPFIFVPESATNEVVEFINDNAPPWSSSVQ